MITTSVWFVTDLHGSSLCFRKLLNSVKSRKQPDVLIVGGDITGKFIVPIVKGAAGAWRAWYDGQEQAFHSESDLAQFESHLADCGVYGWRASREDLEAIKHDSGLEEQVVRELKTARISEWVEMADSRLKGAPVKLYVNAGNDDPFYIDPVLDQSATITRPEGRVVEIDKYVSMISCGYANLTPWRSPRDVPEEELANRIRTMASSVRDFGTCIFNLHCPPIHTTLDQAPRVDDNLRPSLNLAGVETVSAGSSAVREAILEYQPVVALHGHVHEQHAQVKLGRTNCFNPGSEYWIGRLRGVYLRFREGALVASALTREDIAIAGAA